MPVILRRVQLEAELRESHIELLRLQEEVRSHRLLKQTANYAGPQVRAPVLSNTSA